MKILLLINNLNAGGAQRQLVLLANQLSEFQHDVLLACWGDDSHMRDDVNKKIKLIKIGQGWGRFWKLKILFDLRKIIKSDGYSDVISFLDSPNLICGLLRCFFCFNWIPSERNLTTKNDLKSILWRMIFYRKSLVVVCNSHSQGKWVAKKVKGVSGKLNIIQNGISKEFISDKPFFLKNNPLNFVVIARYASQKNPWLVIKAMQKIEKIFGIKASLSWYGEDDPGDPGLRNELFVYCSDNELNVNFYGPTNDVVQILDSASALILASTYEGTPNAVIEAMARNIPVIASNVSDIPLILGDGERGYLFESNNVDSLVNALMLFNKSGFGKVLQKVNSAKGYILEHHSADAMANKYLSFLK